MANNTNIAPMAALAAAAVNGNSFALDNPSASGVQVAVNITAITGTAPSITVIIEGLDVASGVYYALLTSAALTATGMTVLTVYPGVTVAANVAVSQALPASWRIRYTIAGTTPAVTATIGACLIR